MYPFTRIKKNKQTPNMHAFMHKHAHTNVLQYNGNICTICFLRIHKSHHKEEMTYCHLRIKEN